MSLPLHTNLQQVTILLSSSANDVVNILETFTKQRDSSSVENHP